MFKKAFTILELVIAMAVIAILVLVTIPFAKSKLDKVDKFSYYMAYAAVQDIAANIVAQSEYEYSESDLATSSVEDIWKNKQYVAYEPEKKNNIDFAHLKYIVMLKIGNIVNTFMPSASAYAYDGFEEKLVLTETGCSNCPTGISKQCAGGTPNIQYCKEQYPGKRNVNCTNNVQGYSFQAGEYRCIFYNQVCDKNKGLKLNESTGYCECTEPNFEYNVGQGRCVCKGGYELVKGVFHGSLNNTTGHCIPKCTSPKVRNQNVPLDSSETCICPSSLNCNGGIPNAENCTCECAAGQFRDSNDVCRTCEEITSWEEYKNHMPPCPPDCERFGMIHSQSKGTCVMPASATNLCERIKLEYNIRTSACNLTAAQMRASIATGFKDATPHIKLSNGLNIYIATDLVKIDALADAVDVRDRVGYLLYVDVNGSKGKGVLYQDVYPFYIMMTGKILPVYNSDGVGEANNVDNLAGNIIYDDYSTGNRVVKASQTNVDYKTGVCATRYIQSANYCQGQQIDAHCADSNADCRYIVNKPMKFFGR